MKEEPLSLSGRVAIVTGGGRGMGRAMALALAQSGAHVVITAARDRTELESVAREALQTCGEDRAWPLIADVTNEDDCRVVVDKAVEHFGRLDILINNAGRGMRYVSDTFLTEPTQFWTIDPKIWRMVIDTNVNGPFLMARCAVPLMLKAGWGRVINISMNRETMRRRGFSPYGPSKAALDSETIIWSQELADTGVTVNSLLPGAAILTGMIPESVSDAVRSSLRDPSIIIPPMLWLASAESDGMTGHRFVATRWRTDCSRREAANAAIEQI